MSIRTKINPPNDFEMNILDFPPRMDDFNILRFPKFSHVWVENPNQQLKVLVDQYLKDFIDVQSFVKTQIQTGNISIIQVVPSYDPSNDYRSHYICFGADPDCLDPSISFRIDQSWDKFNFPSHLITYLRTIAPILSGAIIGSLDFPAIMLEQDWIGMPQICYGFTISKSIQKEIGHYYFVASDYWSVATIVDTYGKAWLCNGNNNIDFDIRSTGLNIVEWYQVELQNPFRPRPKPNWAK